MLGVSKTMSITVKRLQSVMASSNIVVSGIEYLEISRNAHFQSLHN